METFRNDKSEGRFFLATNCHVLCLDGESGKTLWKVQIQKSISSSLLTLLIDRGRIYAACYKIVAALSLDGEILWRTEISKLGEPTAIGLHGKRLVVAAAGRVFGLSAVDGKEVWYNDLPGLSYHPICLRAPGGVIAQPHVDYVGSGDSVRVRVLENSQGPG